MYVCMYVCMFAAIGNIICIPTQFEDFSFHLPVTLRAPLNSLLREALYKYPYNITYVCMTLCMYVCNL